MGGSKEFGKVEEAEEREMVETWAETWCIPTEGLQPDWSKQTNRLFCPCEWADYHWARYCLATGLGGLFVALGKEYDAAVIYYFYRTRVVVAMKRQKR